jgi:hypothetical protein
MIDNARALITTLSIICFLFVFHDFSFIFVMESEDKYKTSGGNSCAVHACSNNRKKIILWKKSMCELHGSELSSFNFLFLTAESCLSVFRLPGVALISYPNLSLG